MHSKKKPEELKSCSVKRIFFANYSADNVTKALQAIRNGTPTAKASKMYNVPRTTLRNKIQGKAPETSCRVGPESVLGPEVEDRLAKWILEMSKMGFPVNKDWLTYSVKHLLDEQNSTSVFKNNLPGRKWFEGFLRRHSRISEKKSEQLAKARSILTENRIKLWFNDIKILLGEKINILEDPRRVFNMDETAVYTFHHQEVLF